MDCGLFHLMEDFILREVDYSQKYGYSSRAKRYMKRKLNKELAPYIEDHAQEESQTQSQSMSYKDNSGSDSDLDDYSDDNYESKYDYEKHARNCESMYIPKNRVEMCLLVSYISIIFTFYGVSAYIITTYSKHFNECTL